MCIVYAYSTDSFFSRFDCIHEGQSLLQQQQTTIHFYKLTKFEQNYYGYLLIIIEILLLRKKYQHSFCLCNCVQAGKCANVTIIVRGRKTLSCKSGQKTYFEKKSIISFKKKYLTMNKISAISFTKTRQVRQIIYDRQFYVFDFIIIHSKCRKRSKSSWG